MTTQLEWIGCICGLSGALLLALRNQYSRWGWWLFLASNTALICFALILNLNGLLVQQLGFTITSIIGLHKAGFFKGIP